MAKLKKRPPLFRGQDKVTKEWHFGNYIKGEEKGTAFIMEAVNQTYEIDPDTLGQSIGRTDKNGLPIFDGDIIEVGDYTKFIGVVEWSDFEAAVRINSNRNKYPFAKGNCDFPLFKNETPKVTIMGNIYDWKRKTSTDKANAKYSPSIIPVL